jgi:transposase-like protein
MKTGRPTKYSQELADDICAQLAEGRSLKSVCKDESVPSTQTIFTWFRKYPDFLDKYARAKEESADAMAEEILDIADDGQNDWMERLDNNGNSIGWQVNGEHIQRSRVRIDTRKWLASKLKPKKYGDKIEVENKDQNMTLRVIYGTDDKSKKATHPAGKVRKQ